MSKRAKKSTGIPGTVYQVVQRHKGVDTIARVPDLDSAYDVAHDIARRNRNTQVDIYAPNGDHIASVAVLVSAKKRARSRSTDRRSISLIGAIMDAMELIDTLREQDTLAHALKQAADSRLAAACEIADTIVSAWQRDELDFRVGRIGSECAEELRLLMHSYVAHKDAHAIATEDFLAFQSKHGAAISDALRAIEKVTGSK
jgi:hypothetical protein